MGVALPSHLLAKLQITSRQPGASKEPITKGEVCMNLLGVLLLFGTLTWAQAAPSSFSANTTPVPAVGIKAADPGSTERIKQLPDLLPHPAGKPTLMGGTIVKVDRVRDEIVIGIFGGGKTRVLFDNRTHVYRDGTASSASALRDGDRVYVDTMLAGKDIFAKNVRVTTQVAMGQSAGQVVQYDSRRSELVLKDAISPQELRVRMLPGTVISQGDRTLSANDLLSGTLVAVTFQPGGSDLPVARQVSILAAPGSAFAFVGRVLHLDLHLGLLVVQDPRDQKSYEVAFDPRVIGVSDNLQEGSSVQITAAFDGARYVANSIKVASSSKP